MTEGLSPCHGQPLHFTFDYRDAKAAVNQAGIYPPEIRQRVLDIVMEQRRRYAYLFS